MLCVVGSLSHARLLLVVHSAVNAIQSATADSITGLRVTGLPNSAFLSRSAFLYRKIAFLFCEARAARAAARAERRHRIRRSKTHFNRENARSMVHETLHSLSGSLLCDAFSTPVVASFSRFLLLIPCPLYRCSRKTRSVRRCRSG